MKQMLVVALLSIAVLPPGFIQSNESKINQNGPNDLRQVNQRFGEAQVQRDTAQLEQLLADDFTLINPAGKVLSKLQFLADMSSGDLKYESLTYDDVGQRVYPDVAVVTGRVVRRGQYKGQDNSGQFRFIHVFERHAGKWRITIAQATRIAQ